MMYVNKKGQSGGRGFEITFISINYYQMVF